MFENLNFENGGIKNLNVGLGTESAGQFKINIDGIIGSISSTFITLSSNKLQNFTLPENRNCSVSPNPFTNRIKINSPGQFNFSIVNISGETILSGTGEDEKEIITDFPSGIYFIKNEHRTGSKTFKLVKE